jgi:hypothetical protein
MGQLRRQRHHVGDQIAQAVLVEMLRAKAVKNTVSLRAS